MRRSRPALFFFQILIHPTRATNFPASDRLLKTSLAFGNVVPVQDGMVKVVEDRATVDKFAGSAQVVESRADIGVFPQAPTFILLIPAVDFEQIPFPHGHIAADDPALTRASLDDGKREPEPLSRAAHFAGQKKAETKDLLPREK